RDVGGQSIGSINARRRGKSMRIPLWHVRTKFAPSLRLSLSLLVLFLPCVVAIAQSGSQTAPADIRKLEVGKPIEREMRSGESHSYEITLAAGQYLNAVVEQKGIDVVVIVIAPDGKTLTEVNSPNGAQGPEPVALITESAGVYRFDVKS